MCRSEARRIIAFKLFKRLIHFNTKQITRLQYSLKFRSLNRSQYSLAMQ